MLPPILTPRRLETDTPLAVLSDKWRPLAHYFRQNFAQVTNPPIDPLREASGMSLKTRFKNLGNILSTDAAQADVFVLESPFLTTLMYERMIKFDNAGVVAHLDAHPGSRAARATACCDAGPVCRHAGRQLSVPEVSTQSLSGGELGLGDEGKAVLVLAATQPGKRSLRCGARRRRALARRPLHLLG